MKVYPLAKPNITAEEIKAVVDVLKSRNLSLGPKYFEFEKKFARSIGTRYACSVSSGTAGLHLALIAAGIGHGDEVITTPFSFIASANSILYVGAKPVFVDIDPVTYNIDPAKIEALITKKTKAILPVHIFGQAVDMSPIMRLAKKYNLKVIEDACESIGATYKHKQVGTFGESAVFAFYPNKQMTTGEGGMIVTNNKKIYDLCSSLRNQGRTQNMQWLDHKYLGYNYRMDEMSAALGIVQLKRLSRLIYERRRVASLYNKFLVPYSNFVHCPYIANNNTHTWFVYVIVLKNLNINRDILIKQLAKEGISSKPYLPSIHLYSFYRRLFGYKKGDFPMSEKVSEYSLALPIYSELTKGDILFIIRRLIRLLRSYE